MDAKVFTKNAKMALGAVAEEYFRSMNPIAAKIHEDIIEAKNSYENIWETLTDKEKVRSRPFIIIGTFIKSLKTTICHDTNTFLSLPVILFSG